MNDTTTKEGAQNQGQHDATVGNPPANPTTFQTHEAQQNYQNQYDWTKKQQENR